MPTSRNRVVVFGHSKSSLFQEVVPQKTHDSENDEENHEDIHADKTFHLKNKGNIINSPRKSQIISLHTKTQKDSNSGNFPDLNFEGNKQIINIKYSSGNQLFTSLSCEENPEQQKDIDTDNIIEKENIKEDLSKTNNGQLEVYKNMDSQVVNDSCNTRYSAFLITVTETKSLKWAANYSTTTLPRSKLGKKTKNIIRKAEKTKQ